MINRTTIETFLYRVGKRCQPNATIYLLGGTALELLGGSRPTIDLDYVGSDVKPSDFQKLLVQIAEEMKLEVEAVPIDEFIPIPVAADERAIFVGEFEHLNVYVLDPYTIALSKLDRGFDTDIEDVCFLVSHNFVEIKQLSQYVETAIEQAKQFDLNPHEMRQHLQVVRDNS